MAVGVCLCGRTKPIDAAFAGILPNNFHANTVNFPLYGYFFDHYYVSIRAITGSSLMATSTKEKTLAHLQKPVVCKKCTATHFSYQLTCKRCGEYFDKMDAVSTSNPGAVKMAIIAAIIVSAVGIAAAMHLF
jgi:hypothetical protein